MKPTLTPIPVNNIRKILKKKGMKQCQISRLTGKCPDYISGVVNSYRRPSLATAEIIAAALNCSVAEVFPHFIQEKDKERGQC